MNIKGFLSDTYKFINYCELSLHDCKEIWQLRNHPDVRKWMINDVPIPLENHLAFIERLKSDSAKDYFIIKDTDSNIIGSVNISYTESGISERGLFINPQYWGKGHAARSMKEFYGKMRDLANVTGIETVVKVDNAASNGLEQKLGAQLEKTCDGYNHYFLRIANPQELDKSKTKVILRADAGKSIGFGHFVRSLALAAYLADDFDCSFCSFNPSDCKPSQYQLAEIGKTCSYIPIEADSYEEYDSKFLDILRGDEIVVLDNYYFTTEYQKKIKDKGCRLVCIDDMHDRHFVADAVLTMTPVQKESFSIEPYTRFLNGIEHSFLRKPFLDVPEERERRDIKRIVMAMGGADPYGLTNKILSIITRINDNLHIDVIAGDTVDVDSRYEEKVGIHRRLSAEEIVNLFAKSDLGIFPASTICVEALACRLPIAAGWYVDNQKEFYEYGVNEGIFMPLGNFLEPEDVIMQRLVRIFKSELTHSRHKIDFKKGKQDIVGLFKTL